MTSEILKLFEKVIGAKLLTAKPDHPLDELVYGAVSCDEKHNQIVFEIGRLSERNKKHWVRHLNEALSTDVEDAEKKEYAKVIRDHASDRTYAAIDRSALIDLASRVKTHYARQTVNTLYSDARFTSMRDLVLQAFNLDSSTGYRKETDNDDDDQDGNKKHPWGHARLKFDQFVQIDDATGVERKVWGLFFTHHGDANFPVERSEFIARDIESALVRVAAHIPDDDLRGQLFDDNKETAMLRLYYNENKASFIPLLNMETAKKMVDAGIGVNLASMVDFHMTKTSPWRMDDEEQGAMHAMQNRLGLAGVTTNPPYNSCVRYKDHDLVWFRSARLGCNTTNLMTGQAINDDGTPAQDDRYNITLQFQAIPQGDIIDLAAQLNAGVGQEAFIVETHSDKEIHLAIDYTIVEQWIKDGTRFDLGGVFESMLAKQRGYIDRAYTAIQNLGEVFGHHAWGKGMFFYDMFEAKNLSSDLRLKIETYRAGRREDHPEPADIFAPVAEKLREIFARHGLTDDVKKVSNHAGRYAGGTIIQSLRIDLKPADLFGLEAMVERLKVAKDELPPVIADAVALGHPTKMMEEGMFEHKHDRKHPEFKRMCDFMYAPGHLERMRTPASVPDDEVHYNNKRLSAATENIGGYISYFTEAARNGESAEVKAAAAKHLEAFGQLSPAFGALIKKAANTVPALTAS